MKTIKILANVSTRYVGSKCTEELDIYVEDDATPEEIEKAKEDAVREWVFEQIEWGWTELDEDS